MAASCWLQQNCDLFYPQKKQQQRNKNCNILMSKFISLKSLLTDVSEKEVDASTEWVEMTFYFGQFDA